MTQRAIIEALRVSGGLEYVELAGAVYGLYQGAAPTATQLGNTRRAVARLRARGLVETVPAQAVHPSHRPPVRVQLTRR